MVGSAIMRKKFINGLKKNALQLLAITVMLTLGNIAYIGIGSTWKSLDEYQEYNYNQENKADLEITFNPIPINQYSETEYNTIDGIKEVEKSLVFESSVQEKEHSRVLVNAVDMEFELNDYTVIEGERKLTSEDCAIDISFAKANDIKINDDLNLSFNGKNFTCNVNSLVVSSSYIYITPSSSSVIPSHSEYGYIYIINNFGFFNKLEMNVDKEVEEVKRDIINESSLDVITMFSRDETLNNLAVSQKIQQYKTIGSLFPSIFFAVVVLMSFSTMYRLINKERYSIGIMKSIGISNTKIVLHYLSYSMLVSIVSSLVGIIIGWKFIPSYIWKFFDELFIFGDYDIIVNTQQIILVIILSLFSTCFATLIVLVKLNKEVPASLLRNKVIINKKRKHSSSTGLWNKLKSSDKLVLRKIINGKLRAFMTIIGTIGCVALLLSALGIRDTIKDVANTTYEKSFLYYSKSEINDEHLTEEIFDVFSKNSEYEFFEERLIYLSSEENSKNSYIYIQQNNSSLINFYDSVGNEIVVERNDVIITENLASSLNVGEGDNLSFTIDNTKEIELKITKIVPVNIGQGIYINEESWRLLGMKFHPTHLLSNNDNPNYPDDLVNNTIVSENQKSDFLESMSSTMSMSVLLIIAATVLVVVVLYSLGILNFEDRYRDLATLSVLGFKKGELKRFLSIENTILTTLGLILGIPSGILLHKAIFSSAGMGDELKFYPVIYTKTYIITIIFTLILIILITIIVNKKIDKVQMIEALKSVD